MYDYEGEKPGRWEDYGQDFRSFYVGILIVVVTGIFLLADYVRHSASAREVSDQEVHKTSSMQ